MEKFTVSIVTYNDAKRLAYTLESLKNYDSVVVIDKSSTDNTEEIAHKYNRPYHRVGYFESFADKEGARAIKEIWDSFANEWIFDVTCSDIIHPELCKDMLSFINTHPQLEAVYLPLYRYSMGFVSKYSYFGDITYQAKLFKKSVHDFDIIQVHANCLANAKNTAKLQPKNKSVAIYHLTHENLELVMERHLRYARVEAKTDEEIMSREDYLNKSWRKVLGVVFRYIKLRTFKLGDRGRAQLCMLLMYRCANFLDLYMNEEEEKRIRSVYDSIRAGHFE